MATLLRLLLRIFGYAPFERPYLTPVSRTIDTIPVAKHQRWAAGGAIHAIPVAAGLAIIYALRHNAIHQNWERIFSVLVASTWSFVGPASVWYYERYVLPRLNKDCREHFTATHHRRAVQHRVYSPLHASVPCRIIMVGWPLGLSLLFIASPNTLESYGIRGYTDPIWWMLLTGVALISFYTALGICFAYESLRLIQLISRCEVRHNLYHSDGVMGLSFVGEYALATFLLFATGWLFVPALILHAPYSAAFYVLVFGYSTFLVCVFAVPVWMIHRTIRRAKAQLLTSFVSRAHAAVQRLAKGYDPTVAAGFEIDRCVLEDARLVREWPLSVDVGIRFALSVILFPLIVGIAVLWLGGNP